MLREQNWYEDLSLKMLFNAIKFLAKESKKMILSAIEIYS
tara:strand:- start:1018 stop:1137 length:120 start_codon:yes stop_codon:yes gene_type:complete